VAIPEVAFVGSVVGGNLRFYDTATGDKLGSRSIGFAIACGSTIVDGTLLVGGGIGELSANPNSAAYITAQIPHDITALCVLGASDCPARLAGKKLSVKDDQALPEKRAIGFLAKDEASTVSPDPGSPEDPTVNGATLTLLNPTTLETQAIPLPAAGWDGLGNPEGSKGYKYKDPDQALGPCKSAQIKPGKLVKAKCGGTGITFTLDEATQGTLRVSLDVGPASEWRWCSEFGGQITKDEGTVTTGGVGQFKAKNAVPPTACP
jgi:hypothetical protein